MVCSKHGVQDAARKQILPVEGPGPWERTVCNTSGGGIIGTISQKKWDKTQLLVGELADMTEKVAVIQEQEYKAAGLP